MTNAVIMVEEARQPVVFVRRRCRIADLPRTIGEAYSRLMGHLVLAGMQPTGAPYTAYYNQDMEDLDVELGFPVEGPVEPEGDVRFRVIPAGPMAKLMHKGPYSKVGEAYAALGAWMAANGYELDGPSYEFYLNSPQEVKEEELLTTVAMPLRKK